MSGNLLQATDPVGLGIEDIPTELFIGFVAHRIIAAHFIQSRTGSPQMSGITRSAMIFTNYYRIQNILEYAGEGPLSSPGIRSRATTWTLQKMPDIVDIGTRETAEIKSTRQVQLAVAENTADTITRNMESSIGGYHGLTNYSGMESFGQALRLSWTTPRPGAVTYSWEIQDDNGDWNEASAAALAAR